MGGDTSGRFFWSVVMLGVAAALVAFSALILVATFRG